METATNSGGDWVRELVEFLRTQPSVSAVRINPDLQKVAVATIGNIEIDGLEEKLAETITAIEAELAMKSAARVPVGYSVRNEGGALVVGRDHCVTSETMWKWREMDWPEVLPAFSDVRGAADGNLWVSRNVTGNATPVLWDVFRRDGDWLGTVTVPVGASLMHMDTAWVLLRRFDQDDVPHLTRHELRNGACAGDN